MPKTRLYRALRGGEVRVNGARKKAPYQLRAGDKLRIPPLRRAAANDAPTIPRDWLDKIPALFEDESLLVVDKPAGLAAHGGSGLRYGLIEALRALRPELDYLELAHRLDRETSGCLMLAKRREALLGVQSQLRARAVRKDYVALVKGAWRGGARRIDQPLARPSRVADADARAVEAHSVFAPREALRGCTLVAIQLLTGRMHQARAHAAADGHPIAGDRVYGDRAFNRVAKQAGLARMFLHAERVRFRHPRDDATIDIRAELPDDLRHVLDHLRADASPMLGPP
ncbi:MAG: RluA family pseudouridine synthase [bacterium]